MGMLVSVYRSTYNGRVEDCTNRGISATADMLCLVNVEGPFKPDAKTPAALLVENTALGPRRGILKIIPCEAEGNPETRWTMFGGNFAATSDSRFVEACQLLTGRDYFSGAVPIHDRIE